MRILKFLSTTCSTFVLVITFSPPAIASISDNDRDKSVEKGDAEGTFEQGTATVRSDGPAQRSAYGPRLPSFEIDANEEGTEATISISAGGVTAKEITGKAGFYNVARHNLTIKGSFPLSASGDGETAFNFGRLGNFEKIEAGFTYYASEIGVGNGNGILLNSAVKACADTTINSTFTNAQESQLGKQEFLDALKPLAPGQLLTSLIVGDDVAEDEVDPLGAEKFADMREAVKAKCTGFSNALGFVRNFSGTDAAKAFRESTFTKRPILFGGLNSNIGRKEFKFVNAAAFAEQTVKKEAWSLNAFMGLIGSDYQWSSRLQYSYLTDFESAAEGKECRPSLSNPTIQDCLSGAIGGPIRNKTSTVSFEIRKRMNVLFGNQKLPIGFAPQFTYDFEKKEFGIDAPLYLANSSTGKLNGGIRFGYRSDKKDFGVGIFVGAPFQIPF